MIQQGVKIAFDAHNPLAPLTVAASLAANNSAIYVCWLVDGPVTEVVLPNKTVVGVASNPEVFPHP